MRIDFDSRVALAAVAGGFIVLTACAVQPGTQAPAGPDRTAVDASSAEVEAASGQSEAGAPDETASAEGVPGEDDVIAELLAERRRRDYPEIELQESGFTITEQVRIGGDARTEYERALSLLRQERYAEGIQMLLDITASTPGATVPYIDLGIAYEQTGELEQAEKALDTAALLSPDNPIVQNELGILYRKTGRFDEARASYEKALAVFNDFHFARRNLAVLCDLYLADLECALQNYRAYLDSVADDPQVEIWIADVENRMAN
jgi:Flp pilus assembly protein TadD